MKTHNQASLCSLQQLSAGIKGPRANTTKEKERSGKTARGLGREKKSKGKRDRAFGSIALDILINFAHEQVGSHRSNSARQHKQTETEQTHVTEVEECLKNPSHSCFREEVVDSIQVDVHRRGAGREQRRPVPPVVLGVEQEVGRHDRDTHSHHKQDQIHQQHKPVDVVELVVPEAGKDEVHLDEDGPERQNARKEHHSCRPCVPLPVWDRPPQVIHSAREIPNNSHRPAQYRPSQHQRTGHKQPYRTHHHHRAETGSGS
mmetsp:Transcript_9293/g.13670  ORF Transcript_9293/g.13670 Transcript_9293/m.13670 type:complete len:260 (-) Transcript_9293:104-883(-)